MAPAGNSSENQAKDRKIELIQRSLGLRHKLKVHESMKAPETHEELAVMLLAKWELEDELRAIEDVLNQSRNENVAIKRKLIEGGKAVVKKKKDAGARGR